MIQLKDISTGQVETVYLTKISLKLVGKVDLGHPPTAPAVAGGDRSLGEVVPRRGHARFLLFPTSYDMFLLGLLLTGGTYEPVGRLLHSHTLGVVLTRTYPATSPDFVFGPFQLSITDRTD